LQQPHEGFFVTFTRGSEGSAVEGEQPVSTRATRQVATIAVIFIGKMLEESVIARCYAHRRDQL
jgi:hypothetical protein